MTFTGDAKLQWSGVNTNDISDRLKINNGKIATLDIGANNVTFATQIQAGAGNATTGILNKTGSGTLKLAAPWVSDGYNGGTNITQGTLEFVAGAFFPYNTFDTTKANITFKSTGATLKWSTGNTTANWTLPSDGDVSDRLRIDNGVNATLDTNGNDVTFSAATILDGGSSTGSLTKAGQGTLTFATSQTTAATNVPAGYTGGTIISAGTLEFVSGSLPTTGPVTFSNASPGSSSTLRWITNTNNPVNTYDISGRLQITSGMTAILDTNGNDVTFSQAMGSSNLAGQQASPGTLTKAGAGTLTLNAANPNFTGATNIAGGTVAFVTGALPGSGAVTFTGSTTLRWLSGNTDDLSARLTIPSGVTGTVDTNGNNVTFSSAMPASPGDLFKTGGGTLAFNAASNSIFTGGTSIDSGTVTVVAGGLSGTKSVTVSQGATFALQGTSTTRVNDTAAVTMGTGSAVTPAMLQINDKSETMGAFTLAGTSVIDFGLADANAQLKFANSAAASWTGSLSIYNWSGSLSGGGADQLYFGLDSSGLTASQLSMISFYSDAGLTSLGAAQFASGGEVVPVPEPAVFVALFSGVGSLLALRRRRPAR